MVKNRLAILVVCWNNVDDVMECTRSLLVQSMNDFTILILNNGSTDISVPDRLSSFVNSLPTSRPNIELVTSEQNDGTSGAFSIGVKWAIDNDYDYIGALNADAIADKGWLKGLYTDIRLHPNTGIVTGKLLRRDGKTIDTTGDFYTTWGVPGPRLRDRPSREAPTEPDYVFGACGGDFLSRTQMYKECGLYDIKYFMYYEDLDMSFRAQLNGWKVRYTPDSIAYHKLGASSKTVPGLAVYNTFKNLPLLFIKNVPLGLWPTIVPRLTLTYILITGNAIKNSKGNYAIKGWFMSLLLLPHAFKERRHIQRSRKVTTQYISSIILHDIPPEQTGMRKFRAFFTGKQ